MVEHALRGRGAYARKELHQPEAGNAIARVLGKAKGGQHILDMGAIEKLQSAEFDEGNVAAGKFHLQRSAVMRGAEKHGLLLELCAALAIFQHLVGNISRLIALVAHRYQPRALRALPLRAQVLRETLGGKVDHRIGGGQNRLRRAVIAIERDDVGGGS